MTAPDPKAPPAAMPQVQRPGPAPAPRKDKTVAEAERLAERAKKKALLAQVLDRGLVNARLEVKNGRKDRYYAYVRDNKQDLDRAAALGFVIEEEAGESLHGTGDNRRRIGDVVLVSTSMENYEILEELKAERRRKRHAMDPKKQYLRKSRMRNPDVPVLNPNKLSDDGVQLDEGEEEE